MTAELKVPEIGESITEVEIGQWMKSEGDMVQQDEEIVSLESDKATVEVPAPVSGKIVKVLKQVGETAAVDEVIALIEEQDGAAKVAASKVKEDKEEKASAPPAKEEKKEKPQPKPEIEAQPAPSPRVDSSGGRPEEEVRMTVLRRRIAERLVQAQQTAALLTTFNEIDMSAVVEFRNKHKEQFQEQYGVKLGFMSFFIKASVDALKLIPEINAEIRAEKIIYKNYYDIGVAVGGGKGLVVPVIRDADGKSFAELERVIADFGKRAKENSLQIEELQGGTFTISNGGVYGSLLSTPIVNPPQSGVLGLHTIQDRAVVINGKIEIRPMMYVALTYDHRIVDGREGVTFLKRVKEVMENPMRMLLEI